ncbi:hypothetical protein [Alloyangia pacifica]|nr:hypothetical protein [Alloyangia pacifica]
MKTAIGVGGPLTLPDGQVIAPTEWLGTRDGEGGNVHQAPDVSDDRDGTAPNYTFGLPFLNREAFDAIKADQAKATGRDLTCYHAIFLPHEGLLPATPLRFAWRLKMQNVDFSEGLEEVEGGTIKRIYSASVSARSGEAGRSRSPGGTYTDPIQRDRARRLGVTSDSGCAFVAKNAQRTFKRVF